MEKHKLKKAIIFDCDNTLWSGVLGEDKICPIIDIQQGAVLFAKHGIIIGLCSKNNEADVVDALRNQILTEEYISIKRINWKDKASNLKEIAEELNIGFDAMVFVDDSPFERGLVSKHLPDVLCIDPSEITTTVMSNFSLAGDISKTQQYKENYSRLKHQEQFTDISDFLASLGMVLTISINKQEHIPRIVEMTQKTNQFNLTTKRMTEENISMMMQDGQVYSLAVRDKFGDHGITGACVVIEENIILFLLSCRILGKEIEYAFLDFVMKHQNTIGTEVIIANYFTSDKNGQTAEFYDKAGFNAYLRLPTMVKYSKRTRSYKPVAPKYFQYE